VSKLLPREKAIRFGISSLTDEELLALIIKSAYKNKSVYELVDELLEVSNGFENLLSLTYEELISIKGIKQAKAFEIIAILEIAKRINKIDRIEETNYDQPNKVVNWLRTNIAFSDKEEFLTIYLNGKGSIIKSEIMFKGNKNSSMVGIDEILRKAILIKASYILVAHNHPSGNIEPSVADIEITERLAKSASMIGIPLLDHIIISKNDYFSFKNNDMLKWLRWKRSY